MEVDSTEIALVTRDATELSTLCNGLAYETVDDREFATRALREVKAQAEALEEKEKEITRPLRAGIDQVRALFAEPRKLLLAAEAEIKAGILTGLKAEEDALAASAQAAASRGDSEALATLTDAIPTAPAGFEVRRLARARIDNPGIVPHKYFNNPGVLAALEKAVLPELKKGVIIPGAKLVFQTTAAVKG